MQTFIIRNRVLIFFVCMTIVGVLIRFLAGEKSWLWHLWSIIDVSFAVSLGAMAFVAYREMIKFEDEIIIYFEVEGKKIDTGLSLLRKDCTRSEIQGILGMILHDSSKRYNISYMKHRQFLKALHKVQKGKGKSFTMPLSQDEFEQFEMMV